MLKGRTTLLLLFAVVVLGAVLWSVRRRSANDSGPGIMQDELLFGKVLTNVDTVVVTSGGEELEVLRSDGRWRISRPFQTGADNEKVESFLDRLSGVTRIETITAAQRRRRELKLEHFGLQNPTGSVVVVSRELRGEILVGDVTPLSDGVYAMFGGDDKIFVCSSELLALLEENLTTMRQQSLFEGVPERISRIELFAKGGAFTRIVRDGRDWRITEPIDWPANQEVVSHLLDVLFSARIRRFLWDPLDVTGESLASRALSYGVVGDDAEVKVQLWESSGRPGGIEVRFGRAVDGDDGLVAVVRSDMPGIIAMDASLIEELRVPVAALRDSRLWSLSKDEVRGLALVGREQHLRFECSESGEWRMTEPVQVRADALVMTNLLDRVMALEAVGYVDDVSEKMDVYGLDRPVCTLELSDGKNAYRLNVGAAAGMGALTYVQFDDKKKDIIRTQLLSLPEVSLQEWDPRNYQDKVILRVPPQQVHSISLKVDGLAPQELKRNETAEWETAEPPPAEVDAPALEALLAFTADLRASRVEELAVRVPGAFGMDAPWTTLTLGVDGDEAIHRVLLVGRLSADGGRYAMLRGGDVLFVLPPEAVQVLERELVHKPL